MPLPKPIEKNKAIINMKNTNDECFKWAMTRALNPINIHPERTSKELEEQSKELNWEETEFPTPLSNIKKFEENNNIGVNVFSTDASLKVYSLRLNKLKTESDQINLFLWKNHYSVIKDLSRLVSAQISEGKRRKYIRNRCLNAFGSDELLEKHLELCSDNDYQRHEYPEPGSITKFENHGKTQTVPFAIYAEFECYIEGLNTVEQNSNKSNTIQYQKHNPSGFCYCVKCFDNSTYKPKLVHYTQQYEGEDVTKKFVDLLEEEIRKIYNRFKTAKPIKMSSKDIKDNKNATKCYACNG